MWEVIIYILIKSVVINGYNPAEDFTELGAGVLFGTVKKSLKSYSESINKKLKKEFSKNQIKAIKYILANSDDRLLFKSPEAIYAHNANELEIAHKVFDSFKARHENDFLSNCAESSGKPFLGNKDNNDQIIKGIAIIISEAIKMVEQTPEYAEVLTREIRKTETAVEKNIKHLESHDEILNKILVILNNFEMEASDNIDFGHYYEFVSKSFITKKRGRIVKLVGNESDKDAYIESFINVNSESKSVLNFLQNWFGKDNYGTILIYGEPGHGKTMLCNKAVFEYSKGNFLNGEAENVLAVALNATNNIIEDGKLNIQKALVWGGDRQTFSFKDCRGALLFMDGYDEVATEARNAGVNGISAFMEMVENIAFEYDIHIVVLSRTVSVKPELENSEITNISYELLPITLEQQDIWLDEHKEYNDYKESFDKLREDKDMKELLGIPLIFRTIVFSKFTDKGTNIVELYDNLFTHLLNTKGIYNDDLEASMEGLMNLAFEIYRTDTYMARYKRNKIETKWIFFSYIPGSKGKMVGFFHRSFYQYFLAKFLIAGLENVTESNVDTYLGLLAERELDETVIQFLPLMIKKENEASLFTKLGMLIDALIRTEAIIYYNPENVLGDAKKTKIGRATNVFRNVMAMAYALQYVIKVPVKGKLDCLIKTFGGEGIQFYSNDKEKANFISVDLIFSNLLLSDLRGSDMTESIFSFAYLFGADLSGSKLCYADFKGANLDKAILRECVMVGIDLEWSSLKFADLKGAILLGANLEGANLMKADLSYANLSYARLTNADLSVDCVEGAIIGRCYKGLIDPKIRGYNSVRWVDDEMTCHSNKNN